MRTPSAGKTYDLNIAQAAHELFQLAERIAITAAFYVAGKKLGVPIATLFSWILWTAISLYCGNRTAHLIHKLLPETQKDRTIWRRGLALTILATATCGYAIGVLMTTMRDAVN